MYYIYIVLGILLNISYFKPRDQKKVCRALELSDLSQSIKQLRVILKEARIKGWFMDWLFAAKIVLISANKNG